MNPTSSSKDTSKNSSGDLSKSTAGEETFLSPQSPLFRDVTVALEARLGQTVLPLSDLWELKPGSVVTLQSGMNEPVGLFLNEMLVARGEIVAVEDNFGVRIVEIIQR